MNTLIFTRKQAQFFIHTYLFTSWIGMGKRNELPP